MTPQDWLNLHLHKPPASYTGGPTFECVKCKQIEPTHTSTRCPAFDLGTELAKVLTPGDEWKHDLLPEHPSAGMVSCCSKCREVSPICGPCPVPDPITIDWNTAMEYRDIGQKIVDNLYDVFLSLKTEDFRHVQHRILGFETWFKFAVQPKHYLIAAALAAERKEE